MAFPIEVCVSLFQLLFVYRLVSSSQFFPSDILTPYLEHGSKRYSRDIQNCQHVSWMNETFEVYRRPSNKTTPRQPAGVEVHRFADSVKDSILPRNLTRHLRHYAVGSISFVDDPYYMLSVLEPSRRDGCVKTYFSATRSTVSDTVNNRAFGCTVAVNAGYFKVTTGECLGNVVSDGRVIQTSNDEQNANFGIRQDGSIVVGYIPDSEIRNTSNPFRQLVTGVIWLVRNGSNFVNESMSLECSAHEDTGKMETFVNVLSARTAVGHDDQGRVVIAQVDGQTHHRGVNLWQFADLLIAHGVVNAINLDGGGSSTLLYNGVLVNYPSDHCWGHPAYRCQREVSTILCAHDVQCLEPSCNEHGSCDFGKCSCDPPWMGETCEHLNCSETNCSNHGNCSEGACACEAGWMGNQCNESCPSNRYGPGCDSYCWCYGRSYCDQLTGDCRCPPGYYGYGCWRECDNNRFGQDCKQNCTHPDCSGHGVCSPVNGTCLCEPDWTGPDCNNSLSLELQLDDVLLKISSLNITNTTRLTNTTVAGGLANTTVSGGLANTTVSGGLANTTVSGGLANTTVSGGLANTTVSGGLANTTVSGGLANTTVSGGLNTSNELSRTLNYTDETIDETDPPNIVDMLSESRDSPSTPGESRDSPSTPGRNPGTENDCPAQTTCPASVLSSAAMTVVIVVSLLTVLLHAVFCLWTHRTVYRHLVDKLIQAVQQRGTSGRKRRRRKRKRKPFFVPLTQDSSSDCSL